MLPVGFSVTSPSLLTVKVLMAFDVVSVELPSRVFEAVNPHALPTDAVMCFMLMMSPLSHSGIVTAQRLLASTMAFFCLSKRILLAGAEM